jgi:hypothetical protein
MLVLSTYQCWAGTDHGSHQGGVSRFITVMGGSLIFSKNHMLQVFEKSEPKNLPVPGILGVKNRNQRTIINQFQMFQNPQRTAGFMKEPSVLSSSLT